MTSQPAVLVYRVGQLGDTLVALPALQAIVRQHAGSRLVLLTDRHITAKGYVSSWDVLGPTGWFDEVIFYEPRGLSALAKLVQWMTLIVRLRKSRFVQVYNLVMRTSARAVTRDKLFFHHLAGVGQYLSLAAINYPPPRELAGRLPRMTPEWLRLLGGVGADAQEFNFKLPLNASAEKEVSAVWHKHHKPPPDRFVAFAPGSKMEAKRWPEERFAVLGRQLLQYDPNLFLIIVGGSEDAPVGDRLCGAFDGHGVNLAGKLSIYGSAALMSRAIMYIGNDTGTMHLAAMVGVPCVAVFSSRDYPGLWEPYGIGHAILRRNLECSGCMLETCEERNMACLLMISVEAVYTAAINKLEEL